MFFRPKMLTAFAFLSGHSGLWQTVRPVDMPDDDRHFRCRRRVAAALGAYDAVDDGHADAREVAELHAVQDVVAGGMLRLVPPVRVINVRCWAQSGIRPKHRRRLSAMNGLMHRSNSRFTLLGVIR